MVYQTVYVAWFFYLTFSATAHVFGYNKKKNRLFKQSVKMNKSKDSESMWWTSIKQFFFHHGSGSHIGRKNIRASHPFDCKRVNKSDPNLIGAG